MTTATLEMLEQSHLSRFMFHTSCLKAITASDRGAAQSQK